MNRKRIQVIKVRDYGDDWINRLAVVCDAFDKMGQREQAATARYIALRYGDLACDQCGAPRTGEAGR